MALYEQRSVDYWLNTVDYDFVGYFPSEFALMFVDFIKKVNGEEGEENETPLFHLVMMDRVFNEERRCAILVFRGAAKCLDIYSEIASPKGPILLRDIKVGDVIYDRNMKETIVTHCSPIYTNKECYEIELEDNTKFICSNDHKHFIQRRTQDKNKHNVYIEEVLTTDEILQKLYCYKGKEIKYYIPTANLSTEHKENSLIGIREIRKVSNTEVKCISVDSPTESYIFNGSYITHNTTLMAEYLILFIASFGYVPGFGPVNLMMYVSDSIENGVKNLRRNVEYRYENSDFLKALIPNKKIGVGTNGVGYVDLDSYENEVAGGRKFTDIRLEFINNRGNRLVVKGYGASTGVRGAKEMGKRPSLAVLDDIISDEDAKSPTVIDNIENTVYKAVSKALHPKKQKIIWLGTPFNASDPLYKAVESGAWKVSVFPVCERFPVSREEFKPAWGDRFDYDYVNTEYTEAVLVGRPENFNQELMLRIASDEDRLVNDDDIIWYDRELVYKNRTNFNFYITTDFATSEKKSADYSVISVWAVNNNGDYLLVDGFCKQCDASEFLDKVFSFCSMYNPLGVGIEISGQQKTVVSWIRSEMVKRNTYFNFLSATGSSEEGIRPTGDKFSRFVLVVPRFKHKNIWIAKEMSDTKWGREFIDEITKAMKKGFKSKHDDVLDSISMLGCFEAYKPSTKLAKDIETPFEEDFEEIRNTIF